jgi:hypothetical protein
MAGRDLSRDLPPAGRKRDRKVTRKQPSMVQGAGAVIHDRPFEAARDTTGIA